MHAYATTFFEATVPQKVVFAALALAAVAAICAAAGLAAPTRRPLALVADLRFTGPLLGLAVAAMDGLHMMQTTARLPDAVTLRMLAPGLMEMSALVQAGALAGLVGVVAWASRPWTTSCAACSTMTPRNSNSSSRAGDPSPTAPDGAHAAGWWIGRPPASLAP